MGKKLTIAEKKNRKEATKRRNAAFKKLKDEYRRDEEALNKELRVSEKKVRFEKINDKYSDELYKRNDAIDSIRHEIIKMESRIESLKQQYGDSIERIRKERDLTHKEYFLYEKERRLELKQKHGPIADMWSAAEWKSLEEFL